MGHAKGGAWQYLPHAPTVESGRLNFCEKNGESGKMPRILLKALHYVIVVAAGLLFSSLTFLLTLAMLAAYTAGLFA